ncbi:MAG: DUF4340 domain-containing protein [Pseudomonadota bacterium]
MNRTGVILSGLLAAQIALALAFFANGRGDYSFSASEPLIAFSSDAVTAMSIVDNDEETVRLSRKGEQWTLTDFGDFPADSDKAESLLRRLSNFKRAAPVSDRRVSASRYGVADDAFERRIDIETEAGAKTLYLGESPSFKYIYARNGADDAVHTVLFSAFDAPTEASAWVNREAFHVAAEDLQEIRIKTITLTQQDGAFVLADLAAGEMVDAEAVNDIAEAARTLSFDEIANEAPAEVDFTTPDLTLSLKRGEGGASVYRLAAEPVDGAEPVSAYWLQADNFDPVFRVAKYQISSLIDADRDALVSAAMSPPASVVPASETPVDNSQSVGDAATLSAPKPETKSDGAGVSEVVDDGASPSASTTSP